MDTIVITLRLPSELVEWVDSVGKRGAVVAEALESMRSPKRVALTDSNMDLIRAAVRETVEQLEHGPVPRAAERGTHNAKFRSIPDVHTNQPWTISAPSALAMSHGVG